MIVSHIMRMNGVVLNKYYQEKYFLLFRQLIINWQSINYIVILIFHSLKRTVLVISCEEYLSNFCVCLLPAEVALMRPTYRYLLTTFHLFTVFWEHDTRLDSLETDLSRKLQNMYLIRKIISLSMSLQLSMKMQLLGKIIPVLCHTFMVKLSRSRESHPHHNIHQDIDDHSVDC